MNRRRSPTADRRALASALRQLREDSGLSLEQAASEALDASGAKLSRIETGKQVAGPRDVRDLCRLYDVPDERMRELVSWAETAREPGWFDSFGINDDDYLGLESAATAIDQYDHLHVPGILQTRQYAEAYLGGIINPGQSRPWSSRQVTEWLEMRERRLSIIEPVAGVQFRFVLDASVLLRQIGGAECLRSQLAHLQDMARRPNIEIRILPFAAGGTPGQLGGFTVLTLPDGPDVAYIETQAGFMLIDGTEELKRFRAMFKMMQDASEPEDVTGRYFDPVIQDYLSRERRR